MDVSKEFRDQQNASTAAGEEMAATWMEALKKKPPLRFSFQDYRRELHRELWSLSCIDIRVPEEKRRRAMGSWGVRSQQPWSLFLSLPQEKSSIPDWAILLIALTVMTAMVSLPHGVKKVSEAVAQMCGSQRPVGLGRGIPGL